MGVGVSALTGSSGSSISTGGGTDSASFCFSSSKTGSSSNCTAISVMSSVSCKRGATIDCVIFCVLLISSSGVETGSSSISKTASCGYSSSSKYSSSSEYPSSPEYPSSSGVSGKYSSSCAETGCSSGGASHKSFILSASSFCRLMVLYSPTSMVFT